MAVITVKSTVIEFQMAPVIKSLAEKYLFLEEKNMKETGNIMREKEGKVLVRERKERAELGKADGIKWLFCAKLETHFLVHG